MKHAGGNWCYPIGTGILWNLTTSGSGKFVSITMVTTITAEIENGTN